MPKSVFIYDPTLNDPLSKARGIGRYLEILRENFSDVWTFTDNLKSIPADAVFINPFFNFLRPPLVLKRVAKKQIAIIHDLIPLKYSKHFPVGIRGKLNIFLNKLALRNYDVIVTDSKASKKDILEILKIDKNKVNLIYPCLPGIFINSKLNSEISNLDSKFCIYVGDATWNKNLVNLAKAIKMVNVTCVFVGAIFKSPEKINHPWQKELNEFLALTQNDKRFKFAGFVKDYELIKLYQQARVNILISQDEGFGFSYLEAASQMCPSILSDIPVLREISDDKGALFVKPQGPNEIANTIGEIYFNDEKKESLSFQALNRSKSFNSKLFIKSFSQLLKNL